MKRNLLIAVSAIMISACSLHHASAQKASSTSGSTYTTALGLGIDFGNGGTYVGPSVKHFFTKHNVGKAELLFGNGATFVSAYYQYQGDISNAAGLNYTLGLGGTLGFGGGETAFSFRPTAGLDYKIANVPIALEFDWRPAFSVSDGTDFEPARFGLGFRYAF